MVYTADLKSAAQRACGFESRPRYQKGKKMPRRNIQTHMIVKTEEGYVKVDKHNKREEIVDEEFLDILGDIGALTGEARDSYEKRKKTLDKETVEE